jgi:L-amino acid N-acyltransferase YncA
MSITFTIRNAQIIDLPIIVAIYNQTIAGRMVTADLEPVSIEQRLPWFHAHDQTTRPLWVVENDINEIIGWISLQDFYGRPAYQQTAEISIYIDQSFQGKGLGKLLLKEAIERCKQIGLKNLLGFIFGHNLPSIRLIESAKFERWGLFPEVALLDDKPADLCIYGLKIG